MKATLKTVAVLSASLILAFSAVGGKALAADSLRYVCTDPPLEVTFEIKGKHYSGEVHCGNLFFERDIPNAPLIRWTRAKKNALYSLVMFDFDGNASGSWPDPVPPGKNSPVRHWIVGNIPGTDIAGPGYRESKPASGVSILQPFRSPHIPIVSDRYGVYLFEQKKRIEFEPVTGEITNFPHEQFLAKYGLTKPVASNWFVAVYTSESPFSGKSFTGNDVSGIWHKESGTLGH
jgi:hypothetical protein